MTTDLIRVDEIDPAEFFSADGGVRPLLDKIKAQAEGLVFDIETEDGLKDCKRAAREVSSIKAGIDTKGKEHLARLKAQCKPIDSERKFWRDEMDKVRDGILAPVIAKEKAEQAKLDELRRQEEEEAERKRLDLERREREMVEREAEVKRQEAAANAKVEADRRAVEAAERAKKDAEAAAARQVQEAQEAAARAERERLGAIQQQREQAEREAARVRLEAIRDTDRENRRQLMMHFLCEAGFVLDEHGMKRKDWFIGAKFFSELDSEEEMSQFKGDILNQIAVQKQTAEREAQERERQRLAAEQAERDRLAKLAADTANRGRVLNEINIDMKPWIDWGDIEGMADAIDAGKIRHLKIDWE